MERAKKNNLAAPCGLYCGACSILVAYERGDTAKLEQMIPGISQYKGIQIELKDLACDGCLSETVAIHCRDCAIRTCATKKGYDNCADCAEVNCQLISDFNNDGISHHGEVLKNLTSQREIGIAAWAEKQKERWRCSKCKSVVDWYAAECPQCGSPVPSQWS